MKIISSAALLASLLAAGCTSSVPPDVLTFANPADPAIAIRGSGHRPVLADYHHREPVDPRNWRELKNTIPMMTGWGQFGSIEMGGMFSVVKVREGISAEEYADPGWYEHPAGTVAYEWTGELPAAASAPPAGVGVPSVPHAHGDR